MSGEGATSGLIGKLPPLPLSVLHNPSDIHSAIIHTTPFSLFLFQVVSSTSHGSNGPPIDSDKKKGNTN